MNFAGYTWIVLDPDTGYLLMQGSYGSNQALDTFYVSVFFDLTNHYTFAYYLNHDFYNTLPVQDQAVIQSHNWTTGSDEENTNVTPNVNCKIGLISNNETIVYKDIISNLSDSWWSRSCALVRPDGSLNQHPNNSDLISPAAIRPALYVDPDVLVSGGNGGTVLEGAKASTLTKLSAMKAGGTVNFAGYSWIVLDPDKGYLLMQDSYSNSRYFDSDFYSPFNPNSSTNMGYYLNHNFLSSLPAADQALIQSHDWTIGDMKNDTNPALVATCKVGLISFSEYRTYEPLIPPLDNFWWTRTRETDTDIYYVSKNTRCSPSPLLPAVRPALYLDPDILISGGTVLQQTPTPIITAPVSVGATSVSGTAAAGASIVLSVNGVASTAVTADASGHWTVGGLNLAQSGNISVTAKAAGNPVSAAATVQISVNITAITGVTAPVEGAAPVSAIPDTAQYTATIAWSPADSVFAPRTPYTATITITPKAGYTLAGVPRNFFTVAGATATNDAGSGIVTAVFPAIAAQPGTLSALTAGNMVSFAGHQWIVLDPGKGYLLMQGTYGASRSYGSQAFDSTKTSSIAYYLNNDFYNTLPSADQAVIQSHSWTTGKRPNDTNPTPYVTCKIGLISYSEYQAYFHLISNCTGQWRTRTAGTYSDQVWMVYSTGGLSLCDTTNSSAYARPALYLNPDLLVSGGNGGTVSDQVITPPPTIAAPVRAGAAGVSGTAAAGASIVLSVNGTASGAVTSDASGHWAVSGLALAQGDSLSATAKLSGEEGSPAATSVAVAADAAAPIRINAIPGITNPVAGAAPVSSTTATSEYTAAVSWSPADKVFAPHKAYTATITITPKAGYTLSGVPRDFFAVAGATATNSAGSGVVTAVFSAAAGRPGTLSALKAGSTVNFAGDNWIVLDPSEGYLIKLEPYGDRHLFNSDLNNSKNTFDPADPKNIGYYLNHSFYESLSVADQALIQTHDWTTGDAKNDKNPAFSVSGKIGLISYSEYTAYQDLVRRIPVYWFGSPLTPEWWTRTPFPSPQNDENWVVATDGIPDYNVYHPHTNSDYLQTFSNDHCDIHPTLYLNPDIMVSGGDGGIVLRQTPQPAIMSPIAAGATSVSGTAAGGASIVLSVNGSASPAVTADPDGHWTVSGLKLAQHDTVSVTAAAIGNAVSPSTTVTVEVPINIAKIAGVTPPVTGATPVSAIDTPEYTAAVTWSRADATFEPGKAYTATITITPKAGYTLAGLPRNFFTVAGATATNDAGSGIVTAAFPTLAGQPGTLSALAAGSMVRFGGYDWILLDPGKGYLLMKGAYGVNRDLGSGTFDLADQSSIAYYLNHDFYASFPAADQASIQSHQWTIENYKPEKYVQDPNQTHSVTCKIALLSYSEYNAYMDKISDIPDEWWLLNPYYDFNWAVMSYGRFSNEYTNAHCSVRPALYLNRDILVTNGTVSDQILTPTPTITAPVTAGSTSVSGTAAAGASVVLRVNGTPSTPVTSDAGGYWTVSGLTLAQGDSLSATAQLTGENISTAATATVVAPIVTVTDVTVTPSTVTVLIGNSQTFNAAVNGRNQPAQGVTWSVSGNHSAGTKISSSGILTIGIDETAASLTVRATSTFDNTQSGTATVTMDSSKYLTSISMKALPEKINYMAGQSLDITGASLTLSYSDNSTECIPVLPSMVSGFDSAKAGAQTVTVSYQSKATSFSVHVIPTLISNPEHSATVDISGASLPPNVTSVTLGGGIVADDGSSSTFYGEVRKLLGQINIGGVRLFQIELLDQNGNPIKNFGKVTVKIPIPSGMSGNLHVYWYDPDSHKLTDMQATQKDGYLIFETTHFSYYAVAQLNAGNATNISNPDTGACNTSGLWTLLALLAATVTVPVVRRKRFRIKRKV